MTGYELVLVLPLDWSENTAGILAQRLADQELPAGVTVELVHAEPGDDSIRIPLETWEGR